MNSTNNNWLNVSQLANYLHCSKSKIYKEKMYGRISSYKFGGQLLFSKSEIDGLIELSKQEGTNLPGVEIEK